LTYRKQLEDVCQQDFARSKRVWEEERSVLERYYEHWKHRMEQWRERQKGLLSTCELDLYHKYMLGKKVEIRQQAEKVKQCFEDMEQKRERLLSARKEKKIMEKLREQHLADFTAGKSGKEKKFLDALATQSFNFKGNAS